MNNYSLQMPEALDVAEDSENFGTFILQPLKRLWCNNRKLIQNSSVIFTTRIGNYSGSN